MRPVRMQNFVQNATQILPAKVRPQFTIVGIPLPKRLPKPTIAQNQQCMAIERIEVNSHTSTSSKIENTKYFKT